MTTVRLRRHGNSVGITFPAETCIRMGLEAGQELTLIELSDGVKLVRRSVALERQLQLAREVLQEQADALQELLDQKGRT
ncbi:AbrB/MazE/SpoVT family DNA-binding domain-containing protein [Roseomonas sp. SSH11]|uniref:AbrB/MazE/SpoVT family DNA-binding domain-containing protein n=1 Tax=Pararoseomonas baculiformis TaxID=2820812 RepID=A0ABS4AL01_9PROT|nr:AbrB/MazE/SpoVT family DNA-binding domain-containing protein [Pararoseomonas baculiformis]MBP0447718.1 AbrB/MazE/SpoVT family DNA-binding domain-containing protein [Pararoseomonas baculiformis]